MQDKISAHAEPAEHHDRDHRGDEHARPILFRRRQRRRKRGSRGPGGRGRYRARDDRRGRRAGLVVAHLQAVELRERGAKFLRAGKGTRRVERAVQHFIALLGKRGQRRVARAGRAAQRHGRERAAEQFIHERRERLDVTRLQLDALRFRALDHRLPARPRLRRSEVALETQRIKFQHKRRPVRQRRAQQRVLRDGLREMHEHLVQPKLQPAEPEPERVIHARRRLLEQRERFAGVEFAPRAQQFEERKAVRPFEHDEAGVLDGFKIENPEQVRMLHRAQLFHLALQHRAGARVVKKFTV